MTPETQLPFATTSCFSCAEAMSAHANGNTVAHGKPCASCRKRRVKCDRTRPCSNCARSKQLCTYDAADPVTGSSLATNESYDAASLSDASVRDRLARLEGLMAAMMIREGVVETGPGSLAEASRDHISKGARGHRSANSFPLTPRPALQLRSAPSSSASGTKTSKSSPVGQILFQDGYSAYFDSEFWPGMMTEVCLSSCYMISL